MEGRQIKTEDEDENEDEGDTGRTSAWQKRPCHYGDYKWVIDGGSFWRILSRLSPQTKPVLRPRVVLGYIPLRVAAFTRRTHNFISC